MKRKQLLKSVLCFTLVAAVFIATGNLTVAMQAYMEKTDTLNTPIEDQQNMALLLSSEEFVLDDDCLDVDDTPSYKGEPHLDDDSMDSGAALFRRAPVLDEHHTDFFCGTPILDSTITSDTLISDDYNVYVESDDYSGGNTLDSTVVTIVYRGNGHTGGQVPTSHTVNTPGTATLKSPGTMVRSQYAFAGWKSSTSGVVYQAGQVLSFTGQGTIYFDAVWVLSIVTITYSGNGHTGGTVPANQTLTTPGSIALRPQGNLARTGHVFVGWKDSAGNIFAAGVTVSWPTAVAGTLALTAHWVPSIVTITYIGNGHTGGTVPANQTLTTPGSIALRPQGNLTKTGYAFDGWKDNFGNTLAAGVTVSWSTAVAGTLTLTAHWVPSIVTIKYDGNGHTSGVLPTQIISTPGTFELALQGNMGRPGYAFAGWMGPNGVLYHPRTILVYNSAVYGTVTFTAQWLPAGFPLDPPRHMNYWTPPASSGITNILLKMYYIDPSLDYNLWMNAMDNGRNAWNNSTVPVSFGSNSFTGKQVLAAITTDTEYLGYMQPLQITGTSMTDFYIMLNGATIQNYLANNSSYNLSNVVQSIMAHELAHTIGLRDGEQPQNGHHTTLGGFSDASLMNAGRNRNNIRDPRPFDIVSASIIYN